MFIFSLFSTKRKRSTETSLSTMTLKFSSDRMNLGYLLKLTSCFVSKYGLTFRKQSRCHPCVMPELEESTLRI